MKDVMTVEELEQEILSPNVKKKISDLEEALKRLQEERHYVVPAKTTDNVIKFGLISDTHAGSLYERFDALTAFCETLEAEGITTVLHAGDVLDGNKIYKGQEYEQYAHGVRGQLKTLKDKIPKTNIDFYFITGNHDYSFDRQVDMGIGDAIANETGWSFIGRDQGLVELKTKTRSLLVGLYHPDGGTSYALSYKAQKLVEKIPGGQKPNIVGIGHYHKALQMPMYRNVSTFKAGAFQSQTPFMARKPTDSHVGGWIIEVTLGDHLTQRVKAEFISFYEPAELTLSV
jgi:predicted phosphodiesterase